MMVEWVVAMRVGVGDEELIFREIMIGKLDLHSRC